MLNIQKAYWSALEAISDVLAVLEIYQWSGLVKRHLLNKYFWRTTADHNFLLRDGYIVYIIYTVEHRIVWWNTKTKEIIGPVPGRMWNSLNV